MADIVTGTVTGQLDTSMLMSEFSNVRRENATEAGDVRRELAVETGGVRREVAKEASDSRTASAREAFDVNDRVGSEADRVVAQDTAYFIAGQGQSFSNATALASLTASTNANFNQTLAAIQLAASQTSAAATLAAAQSQAANALGQALIGQQIVSDGNSTRALINNQTIDELRFKNLDMSNRHHGDHGNHHNCHEGRFTYGPPTEATYSI